MLLHFRVRSSPYFAICRQELPSIFQRSSICTAAQGWVSTSSISLLSFLLLCSSSRSLPQTKEVHSSALVHGFLPNNVSLCASLILKYAAWGHSSFSFRLFDQTVAYSRTAFLWNTLIRACSIAGFDDHFLTYNRMIRSGITPDDHTFPFVLKICADYTALRKGMEIHGSILKLGFDSDTYVGNTLLLFYGCCRNINYAGKLFGEMPDRDVVSWNTMLGVLSVNGCMTDALHLLRRMMRSESEVAPNVATIVTVLPVCTELEDDSMTAQIHCVLLKLGMKLEQNLGNALIDAYGKCRNINASVQAFREMDVRNAVSWNAVITSFSHGGFNYDSLDMFRWMIDAGLKPDLITISTIFPVLGTLGYLKTGKEVHQFTIRSGMDSEIFVANSLVDMYAKLGHPRRASNLFYNMKMKNLVSWNSMIFNFARNGLETESIELVRQMQVHGEIPDSVTITNVLPSCSRLRFLRLGKEIHGRSIRTGSAFDVFVSNALMDMYTKCGCMNLARTLCTMSKRDQVTYNILIVGYAHTSDCVESLHLFSRMGHMGLKQDVVAYMGVISACVNLSLMKRGREIHGYSIRRLANLHLFVANSLLELYTKCGHIDIARELFDRMPEKDVASWNTMILGYGMLGDTEIAVDLFEAMRESGVSHDSISYIAILSACSNGGLLDEGRKYFSNMQASNMKPTCTHYACMVNLLGRAGHVEEAADLIRSLTIVPDSDIWGAMLSACRMHGNVEYGRWAARRLFNLNPEHSGSYVLLSNMYAEAGRWNEVNGVRKLMKWKKVRKGNPGLSWVETHDQRHPFEIVGSVLDSSMDARWMLADT